MSRGRKGYDCTLTSLLTGKTYEFQSTREASEWLGFQRSYLQTCIYKGYRIKNKHTGERFTCEYETKKQKPRPKGYKEQPCCTCSKAIGGCAWADRFEPVAGWDAVPTIIRQEKGRDMDSFAILRCPDYEMG
jgi:hypothetical protein